MCNKPHAGAIRHPGHVTILVNICVLALFLINIGPAASAQSVSGDGYNASNNVIINPTPTPIVYPTPLPPSSMLSGYILDSRGNKVPDAYVTLFIDSTIAPIDGNPAYIGNIQGSDVGAYSFSGLIPGNYSVKAEKDDIWLYNGTASIWILGNTDARLDVTLVNYVFSPRLSPTPEPLPEEQPTILPIPVPSTTGDTEKSLIGSFSPLIILPAIFGIIVIIGAIIFYRVNKRPASAQKAVKALPNKQAPVPGVSSIIFQAGPEYTRDIEELAAISSSSGMTDSGFIKKINEVAKKYGIDQNRLFYDIKKVRGNKDKK